MVGTQALEEEASKWAPGGLSWTITGPKTRGLYLERAVERLEAASNNAVVRGFIQTTINKQLSRPERILSQTGGAVRT